MADRVWDLLTTMDYGPAPESDTAVNDWLDARQRRFGMYIGGEMTAPGRTFPTVNPATAQPIAQVTQATGMEVDAAVAAARAALPVWAGLSGHARARYLYAIARHIQRHSRHFAVLETMDNGKPIRETRDIDIPLAARHFSHHAGWAQVRDREFPGHEPVGVCGQVIPWNFPFLILSWKIAPALAAGNTVVLKPAEWTSLTALAFAELCRDIDLPPGVVNIVTGDGAVGAAIVEHPDVDKVAFTGSTEVGRIIRKATAGSGKKISLELGGKSPYVVFDSADLDSAVEGVVDAIWFNQGQVCCAGSRLLVQESVNERFIAKLRARMETLRVGDPLDKSIDIGAIIAPPQLEKITRMVAAGAEEGATLWQPSWACPAEGYFYPPTLLTGVEPASTVAQEEIFGPVLVAMTFRTPSEAVALANNTRFGLAASVWSDDLNLALDVSRQITAGVVWVNSTNLFDASAGFGGYRESGYGRDGGREGMYDYLRPVEPVYRQPKSRPVLRSPRMAKSPPIDRTPKMFIGGKQVRPDSGYSRRIVDPQGALVGEVGEGNRKDIRNAVEAARAASGWADATAYNRAQILYFIAENLDSRRSEFSARLGEMTGFVGDAEVEAAINALFTFAAMADKWDGAVHHTPLRNVTLAMPEPIGTVGIVCPDSGPLIGFVTLVAAAISMGNTVVAIPSPAHALSATDLYQVLETSDVPGGVVNIVTGGRDAVVPTLAEHLDIDALWYFGPADGAAAIEAASVGNLKQVWVRDGDRVDWPGVDPAEFLRHATQVKNIWVPYGA